jgi:hypothetical protein
MQSRATLNLGTNTAFALEPRKTTGNFDRAGRSQDLPDANWLLDSSPTLNTRTLTPVPSSAVALLKNGFMAFYSFFVCLDKH